MQEPFVFESKLPVFLPGYVKLKLGYDDFTDEKNPRTFFASGVKNFNGNPKSFEYRTSAESEGDITEFFRNILLFLDGGTMTPE